MNIIQIVKASSIIAVVSACLLLSNAHAGKLYKWVDADGNISYQDNPPPKDGKVLSEKDVKPTSIIRSEKQESQNKTLPPVTIYTMPACNQCDEFIFLMRKNKVPHISRPIKGNSEAQRLILEKVGGIRAPTTIIGDDVLQKISLNEFRTALIRAGYNVEQITPPNPVQRPTSESSELWQ